MQGALWSMPNVEDSVLGTMTDNNAVYLSFKFELSDIHHCGDIGEVPHIKVIKMWPDFGPPLTPTYLPSRTQRRNETWYTGSLHWYLDDSLWMDSLASSILKIALGFFTLLIYWCGWFDCDKQFLSKLRLFFLHLLSCLLHLLLYLLYLFLSFLHLLLYLFLSFLYLLYLFSYLFNHLKH